MCQCWVLLTTSHLRTLQHVSCVGIQWHMILQVYRPLQGRTFDLQPIVPELLWPQW